MIPRSTTITPQGRALRQRVVWGVGSALVLVVLAVVFTRLDRSTVVDGPAGSSHVTTATGLAGLYEVFARDGRRPARLERPLSAAELDGFDTYLVADVDLTGFEAVELAALAEFVEGGGSAVVLGLPPGPLLDTFEIDVEWTGRAVGTASVDAPLPDVSTVAGTRFGAFRPGHGGQVLAGTGSQHLVVSFARGDGTVFLVADSSIGHNATIDQADNVDLLGGLMTGRTLFDEHRHGYDDTPATGVLSAAPGNWIGAMILGGLVLGLALVSYGRRFGPVEPRDRVLAPDRSVFIDSVARSLRRAGPPLPTGPLEAAMRRELGLAPDATMTEVAARAGREGVEPRIVADLESGGSELPLALDHALATLTTRRTR